MLGLKRTLAAAACLLVLVLLVNMATVRGRNSRGSYGTVTVAGATGAEWSMSVMLEAFTFDNNATVTFTPVSSRYGIEAVAVGSLELGVASWLPEPLPDGLVAVPYAMETISILVNKDNPVKQLSLAQLRGIATGEITNWKELGGADEKIMFYGRKQGSGMRNAFEAAIDAAGICSYTGVFNGSGAIANQIARQPGAIGYTSTAPLSTGVAGVALEGASPTQATLRDGSYPITQTFYLVWDTKREHDETVEAFLDFFREAELGSIIERTGAVELPRSGADEGGQRENRPFD